MIREAGLFRRTEQRMLVETAQRNAEHTLPIPEEPFSHDALRAKMRDPLYLPSLAEMSKAFSATETNGDEASKWYEYLYTENPTFEIFTREYIEALSNRLAARVVELGAEHEGPVVILEVGAGNGKLSHFLQQKLDGLVPGKAKIIATDTEEWDEIQKQFPVEQIDQKEALAKYQPRIVLASWMPNRVDWTEEFRATPSVDEYVLIGERGGPVGHLWKTWGVPVEDKEYAATAPPYVAQGFTETYLKDLSRFQTSRLNIRDNRTLSGTTSFKRVKPED